MIYCSANMDERWPTYVLKQLPTENLSQDPFVKVSIYNNRVVFTPSARREEKVQVYISYIEEVKSCFYPDTDQGELEIITSDKKSFKVTHLDADGLKRVKKFIDKKIVKLRRMEERYKNPPLTSIFHGINLTVKDIKTSEKFYKKLGFKKVYEKKANGQPEVVILKNWLLLELSSPAIPEKSIRTIQNIESKVVQYFSIKVSSAKRAREVLIKKGLKPTKIKDSGLETDHFFIKDPDGMSIEMVEDNRYLSPQDYLYQQQRKVKKKNNKKFNKSMKSVFELADLEKDISSRYSSLPRKL